VTQVGRERCQIQSDSGNNNPPTGDRDVQRIQRQRPAAGRTPVGRGSGNGGGIDEDSRGDGPGNGGGRGAGGSTGTVFANRAHDARPLGTRWNSKKTTLGFFFWLLDFFFF
jgi:hypothetical protein